MLKRVMIVLLASTVWMASTQSRATDTVELTPDNVVTVWQNINEVILVLSASIALDDEWIDGLRDLQPSTTLDTAKMPSEMNIFHEKLNAILNSSDLKTLDRLPHGDDLSTPALYVNSGILLDHLLHYLIASDSLASVSIYYGEGEDTTHGMSDQDVVAQINLANQRLDAFIEENGL